MQLTKIIIASLIMFPHFFCYGMDQDLHISDNVMNQEFEILLQKYELSLQEFESTLPDCTKKEIKLSPASFDKIAQQCAQYIEERKNQDLQTTAKLESYYKLLTSEIEQIKSEIEQSQQEVITYTQELHDLKQKHTERKEIIFSLQTKIAQEEEQIAQLKQQNEKAKKKFTEQSPFQPLLQPQIKGLPFSLQKWLYKACGAKGNEELLMQLTQICYDKCQFPNTNNEKVDPYWNSAQHLLIKKVHNRLLMFSPCTKALSLTKESYSAHPASMNFLPEKFLCQKPCNNPIIPAKELLGIFGAIDDNMLISQLQCLTKILYQHPSFNTKTPSSFDKENHLLIGKVNNYWIYTFCPCNSAIGVTRGATYPCSFEFIKKEKLLPEKFLCAQNCTNYSPKKCTTQFDSSSSCNSYSDDDSGSEQLISKAMIDRV